MLIIHDAIAKPRRVALASSQWRSAGGAVSAVPAISDGDLTRRAAELRGASYQFLVAVFAEPVAWVDITAQVPKARALPFSLQCGAKNITMVADLRPDFPEGKKLTRRYRLPTPQTQVRIGTAASAGAVDIFEVSGWRAS